MYKDAREFQTRTNSLLKTLPPAERFALVNQGKRALNSVVLNIAESANKATDKEMKVFLNRARCSLNEFERFVNSQKSKVNSQRGFTIPELLVALLVFSLVIGGGANLLLSGIAAQRNSLAAQELLDQSSFAAEYMTRALRQAQKDLGDDCISPGTNYEITDGGRGIQFLDVQGVCRKFSLPPSVQAQRIKETPGPGLTFLTSDNLTVTSLRFSLQGESQEDELQPRVTFSFEIEAKGARPDSSPKLRFQTTVSQRNVDVYSKIQ